MYKISIPKPCNEDWQQMTPTNKGAFCKSCAKEVIDFTGMTDDAVKKFLLDRKQEKLCGRFKPQQLHRIEIPVSSIIFSKSVARWKKYLAILLLIFGSTLFGCNVIMNKPVAKKIISTVGIKPIEAPEQATVGVILPPIHTVKNNLNDSSAMFGTAVHTTDEIKGDVSICVPGNITTDSLSLMGKPMIDTVRIGVPYSTSIEKMQPSDSVNCGGIDYY